MELTAVAGHGKKEVDLTSAALHVIAMSSMLIDHTLQTVVANDSWICILGRLAFPIYAFLAAEGCFYTRHPKQYGLRLLAFALVSEVPYDLMKSQTLFDPYDQNVIWTFLIAFLCLRACQKLRATENRRLFMAGGMALALAGVIGAFLLNTDYGGMGVLMVFLFYFLRERTPRHMLLQFLALAVINVVFLGGLGFGVALHILGRWIEVPLQGFALLALPLIWLYHGQQGHHNKVFQYFCYGFYPIHMLALAFLARLS